MDHGMTYEMNPTQSFDEIVAREPRAAAGAAPGVKVAAT